MATWFRTRLKRGVLSAVSLAACSSLLIAQQSATPTHRGGSDIHGKIVVTREELQRNETLRTALFERYNAHGLSDSSGTMHHALPVPNRLSEKAVIYLESDEEDRQEHPVPQKHPVLDQKGLQFHPQVLPVAVGTTVDFPNRDNIFHNVFSYSQPKEFDLGRYPKDESRSVRFDVPGTVRVYCDIHSHMSATILVLRLPYFATPDDNGNYVIPGVPEGVYRAVFWYGRDVVETRPVTVRADEPVELNFTY